MGRRGPRKQPDISHQFNDALSRDAVLDKAAKNASQTLPRGSKVVPGGIAEARGSPDASSKKVKRPSTTGARQPPKRSSIATTQSDTTADVTGNGKEDDDYRKVDAKGQYGIFVQTRRCEELCSNLGLTKRDIRKMKRKYDDNDMYHTGEITQAEFFFVIREERRPLTLGIFRLADVDESQKFLSFDEYLLCVVTFATFTKPELYQFVFDLYDDDQSGALEEREFAKMSLEMQSPQFNFPANVSAAIKMLEGKEGRAAFAPNDGLVDLAEFMKLARNFPVAFYPILNMQKNIRAATLGESRWSHLTANKLKVQELVSYMRRHQGAIPALTLCESIANVFSNEIYNIRKRSGEIYALELARRNRLGAEDGD